MRILFLGPCRKHNRRTGAAHQPFDPTTPSGKYVELVQKALQSIVCEFRLSNVIDRAHFGAADQLEKNPTVQDLLSDWDQFDRRLKKMDVDFIVAFGSTVRDAFARVDRAEYISGRIYCRGDLKIVFAPHPSFVMIYRRKRMQKYISSLSQQILENATLSQNF